jgi:transposase InsO family protein
MDLARYVVDAVLVEGRGVREVARSVGRSPAYVSGRLASYRRGGYEALAPRSKAPHHRPSQIAPEVEQQIVELRKSLLDLGLDAGPHSIQHHLSLGTNQVPSLASIWRILKRRGFVSPQPQKKPRAAWLRFESELPNETWQADITSWKLSDGSSVEILDFIDDYSRVILGARALPVYKAQDVVETFHQNARRWGYPASCLTDNGAVFNARSRKGRVTFEIALHKLGIDYKHSRPYHPQTCGKIERFHQTLKKHLVTRQRAESIEELQAQLDWFVNYYNTIRPHRAKGRRPPIESFNARDKAVPGTPMPKRHLRVRTDKIDKGGKVTLRHNSKFIQIGVGRAYAGTRVRLYINDLDVRVVTMEGELLRHIKIDPSRTYQPQNSWSAK